MFMAANKTSNSFTKNKRLIDYFYDCNILWIYYRTELA